MRSSKAIFIFGNDYWEPCQPERRKGHRKVSYTALRRYENVHCR